MDNLGLHLPPVQIKTSSPRYPLPPPSPTSATMHRRVGIAVDLSEESAYAVKWAVHNYLRQGDSVILIHVFSTSVLYGADWGSNTPRTPATHPLTPTVTSRFHEGHQKQQEEQDATDMEDEHDNFTSKKANALAQPLADARVPFKMHVVKDHDMKERLCLEVERLALSVLILGSRGTGASKSSREGRLGSVCDYCVQHCVCPVVVVRFPDQEKAATKSADNNGK